MTVYADTSFLFSLYVPDANSQAAAAAMRRIKPPLLITDLGEFELINTINWRIFRRQVRLSQERAVLALLAKDIEESVVAVAPLNAAMFARARRLARTRTRQLGTRSLDVLHVAAALVLKAETFFTFDIRQAELAKAESLKLQ